MPNDPSGFHVITNGPGSGKSTLIKALPADGSTICPKRAAPSSPTTSRSALTLSWVDRATFAELMEGGALRYWHEARNLTVPVFFDRGVPDVPGYLRLCSLPVRDHVREAARRFRYHSPILIGPPWPAMFETDAEKNQDYKKRKQPLRLWQRRLTDDARPAIASRIRDRLESTTHPR